MTTEEIVEANRIAANLLINVSRDRVVESLDADVSPEFEEAVYYEVRAIGEAIEAGER